MYRMYTVSIMWIVPSELLLDISEGEVPVLVESHQEARGDSPQGGGATGPHFHPGQAGGYWSVFTGDLVSQLLRGRLLGPNGIIWTVQIYET